jgi:nickel-type superoxide dismutase maturation protease
VRWPIWRVAVAERSMEPTLRPGDWLLAWRGLRSRRHPARDGKEVTPTRPVKVRNGQLVVARHPHLPDLLLVKRAAWREANGWWLTADNPKAGGTDSFRFGAVPSELIEGRVLIRYWPPFRR